MTSPGAHISVVDPLTPAIEHVKNLLFRPFDVQRWLVMGFCAWLATLGQSGGGGGGAQFNPMSSSGGDPVQALREAHRWVLANLDWLIPLVAAGLALILTVWVVFTWLSSRGQFMFLHNVATGRAEVREPWCQYASHAHSLFGFRLALGLIGLVVVAPLILGCVGLVLTMVIQGTARPLFIVLSALSLLAGLAAALGFAVVGKLTLDFIVPLMALRHTRCRAAWRELRPMIAAHLGGFVLYFLFQIVIGVVIGTLVIVVVLITCCCAGCLMAVPYLGTVLLLPILVFQRAYSLYYLAQYGPAYRLITL